MKLYGTNDVNTLVATVSTIEATTHEVTELDETHIDYNIEYEPNTTNYSSGFQRVRAKTRGIFNIQIMPIAYPSVATNMNTFYNNLLDLLKERFEYHYIYAPNYRIKFMTDMTQCLRVNIINCSIESRNGYKYIKLDLAEVKTEFAR